MFAMIVVLVTAPASMASQMPLVISTVSPKSSACTMSRWLAGVALSNGGEDRAVVIVAGYIGIIRVDSQLAGTRVSRGIALAARIRWTFRIIRSHLQPARYTVKSARGRRRRAQAAAWS
jgi:hypothetical protein